MSLAIALSRALVGVDARLVHVEVHLANGLPAFSIVGLPELAVRESKDRVRAAIINSHFEFPLKRITVNLAPADLPKEGSHFDLAIAVGILAASSQIPADALTAHEFIGELALSGRLRTASGSLPIAVQTTRDHRSLILPAVNADEAALIAKAIILPASHLLEVCGHLSGSVPITTHTRTIQTTHSAEYITEDMADVKGQQQAKRALEIAAAGQHNLLMYGPPGTGKTMLASRLPGILPPMTEAEAMESAAIASISNEGFNYHQWGLRPFRSPHHTASSVALVGGGSFPRPGEISLAHNGVLFLDELPEYDRKVLEVLREPLEKGHIIISRAARQSAFPARFQLIAAMNPCPCGYLGDRSRECRCTPEQIRRYKTRLSGPLLDRIDLHIHVPRITHTELKQAPTELSTAIRERVIHCREKQIQRTGLANAQLNNRQIETYCQPDATGQTILNEAIHKLGLSARAYHRILKVARTIADLTNMDQINTHHISEAISFRSLDRTPN